MKLLPDTLPADAAPLGEGSQIESSSVFLCDLYELEGKNVHVMFNDGETLTGLLHSFKGKTFKVGLNDETQLLADVVSFKVV